MRRQEDEGFVTALYDSRVVPMFPQLLPFFREAFEMAEDGAEWVITRYRKNNQHPRTQMRRIIKKAGLKPWEKIFQNLRASCETELMDKFPMHVVCEWIGHTPKVANEHYLQTTTEHFRKAAAGECALQNALQYPTERGGKEWHPEQDTGDSGTENNDLLSIATHSLDQIGEVGFEPTRPVKDKGF